MHAIHQSRRIESAAILCHEANRGYCESIGDTSSQPPWIDAPAWQKGSAIAGVQQIFDHPDTTPEQSHEGWLKQKAADGWVWGETKDAEKKTHPCIRPYAELDAQQRMKDAIFGGVARGALYAYGPRTVSACAPVEHKVRIGWTATDQPFTLGMHIIHGRAGIIVDRVMRAIDREDGYAFVPEPGGVNFFGEQTNIAMLVQDGWEAALEVHAKTRWPARATINDFELAKWAVAYRIVHAVMAIEGVEVLSTGGWRHVSDHTQTIEVSYRVGQSAGVPK